LAPLLRISAPILLLSAFNGSQMGALSGFEAFRVSATITLYSGLSSFPFIIAGVYFSGIRGAVWALLASTAVACVLSHRALRKEACRHAVVVTYRGIRGDVGILWRFTAPAVIAGALVQPVHWLCNAVLVRCPGGYAQMGLLNAANQWRSVIMFIPTMMAQAALPILASTHAADDKDAQFSHGVRVMQSLMVGLAFPVASVLMFGSDLLLRLYGKSYQHAAPLLIGTIATATVQSIGAATGPAIEARGRMWFALAMNGMWAVSYYMCVNLAVGRFGANALAYGQVIAYSVITVFVFVVLRRELPRGLLSRAMASLALVWLLIVAALCTAAELRAWLALPVLLVVTVATLLFLVDRQVGGTLMRRVRGCPVPPTLGET
jgi:O-antigen/teichoic acid export membrane protein